MTQEDKSLLLKDLCARLPYGVYVEHTTTKIRGKLKGIVFNHIYNDTDSIQDINAWVIFFGDEYVDATYFRPILRPISSMTEEEKEEMHNLLSPEGTAIYKNDGIALPINHYGEFIPYKFMNHIIQYLLKNHFDFMGLIPKNIAIEVTESNNPYKE